jgi:hypothetical protein
MAAYIPGWNAMRPKQFHCNIISLVFKGRKVFFPRTSSYVSLTALNPPSAILLPTTNRFCNPGQEWQNTWQYRLRMQPGKYRQIGQSDQQLLVLAASAMAHQTRCHHLQKIGLFNVHLSTAG